jgi:ribosomal protein S18 acetylase RimI-like enzyme
MSIDNNYNISPINSIYFSKVNVNPFIDLIYNNFINLSKYPSLKHTKHDINKLLKSPGMRGYVTTVKNNKLLGYLIGEVIQLADRRKVFYISYLYIAKRFRNKKIGSKLMDTVISTFRSKYDGIMLTCDTDDLKVFEFYQKKGFMLDLMLRQFNRHDVMFLKF